MIATLSIGSDGSSKYIAIAFFHRVPNEDAVLVLRALVTNAAVWRV